MSEHFSNHGSSSMSESISPTVIQIKGVVIPPWLVVCLLLTAILSALSLLVVWQSQIRIERELRILQVHCSDIENTLIRSGIAAREDFITSNSSGSTTQPTQPAQSTSAQKKGS